MISFALLTGFSKPNQQDKLKAIVKRNQELAVAEGGAAYFDPDLAEQKLLSIMKSPPLSALTKKMARFPMNADEDDNSVEVVDKSIDHKVTVRPSNDLCNLFFVAPRTFKSNNKTFAYFAMHLPGPYDARHVEAHITFNCRCCEITFTTPTYLTQPRILAFNNQENLCPDVAIFQALVEWKEHQQDHSNAKIKKTSQLTYPLKLCQCSAATFSLRGDTSMLKCFFPRDHCAVSFSSFLKRSLMLPSIGNQQFQLQSIFW